MKLPCFAQSLEGCSLALLSCWGGCSLASLSCWGDAPSFAQSLGDALSLRSVTEGCSIASLSHWGDTPSLCSVAVGCSLASLSRFPFNSSIKLLQNLHSRGSMKQHFYVWEPRCGTIYKVPMHMHSFALENSIANLVVSYIRFNTYGNGMGTLLIASLATHRLISCYVSSLLAPKSHSSSREQNASLIARSSSFAYANNGFHSFAQWPRSLGLRPCSGAGNPHPLRSMLIDVCLRKHQWRHSVLGFPLP